MTSKTVLITGAAKRIGAAVARHLHHHGMNIVVHYNTSEADAAQLVENMNAIRPGSALKVKADLLDADCYSQLVITSAEFKGSLDVLINNASLFFPTKMGETTIQHWTELTGTNLMAPYFLSQESMPYLRANKGCIVNITDIYGDKPLKDHPVYSATKAGLIMLTQAMAMELGPEVRVNAVSPGAILWPEHHADSEKEQIITNTLLQRMGSPEDIAAAVRYLIEDAGYVTGQILKIDGGRFY